MKIFTAIANKHFLTGLIEDALMGETNRTINRKAKTGDKVLFYFCAPISSIVGEAIINEKPKPLTNPTSEWFGSYTAEMTGIKIFEKVIARRVLLQDFPDWGRLATAS